MSPIPSIAAFPCCLVTHLLISSGSIGLPSNLFIFFWVSPASSYIPALTCWSNMRLYALRFLSLRSLSCCALNFVCAILVFSPSSMPLRPPPNAEVPAIKAPLKPPPIAAEAKPAANEPKTKAQLTLPSLFLAAGSSIASMIFSSFSSGISSSGSPAPPPIPAPNSPWPGRIPTPPCSPMPSPVLAAPSGIKPPPTCSRRLGAGEPSRERAKSSIPDIPAPPGGACSAILASSQDCIGARLSDPHGLARPEVSRPDPPDPHGRSCWRDHSHEPEVSRLSKPGINP